MWKCIQNIFVYYSMASVHPSCRVVLPLLPVTGDLDNVKENPRKLLKSPYFVGAERRKDLLPIFAEPALFCHYFSFYSAGYPFF